MFDFKTLLEEIWPSEIDPEGDLSKLFDALADNFQDIYDEIQSVAHIRDPRRTNILSDLEREYGIVSNSALSDEIRRQMLAHIKYEYPTSGSWEHLQNALINAGFNLVVTENNPVVDPADVTIDSAYSDLLVNGNLYIAQDPSYYMAAGSSIAYAGHNRGYSGYYVSSTKTLKTYSIPTEIKAHWTWRYVFWVGGIASGWSSSPEIAVAQVDPKRETQLRNLILKYKPLFTWCVLAIEYPHLLAGTYNTGHIFRSLDDGMTWEDLGQQAAETAIRDIIHLGNGICLASTQILGKIFRSTDYGATWSDLGQQYSQTSILPLCDVGNGICLAGTASGGKILRSVDYGATWSDLDQQGSATWITALCYLENGICLAGTYNNGKILRSIDYGETWSDLGQQGSETGIYSLVYLGNGICLAGSYGAAHIFKSEDYGATWSDIGAQASEAGITALCHIKDGICLAGTQNLGKILRSVDYGETWEDLGQQGSETRIYCILYYKNGICFAGTSPGGEILISRDYGETWSDELGQLGSESAVMSLCKI